MKRRILALLLALCLSLSLGVAAFAEEPEENPSGQNEQEEPEGDDGYTEWDGTSDFPTTGKVRLSGDSDTLTVSSGDIDINSELTIDLNGKKLNIGKIPYFYSLNVLNGGSLRIEDNSEAGNGQIVGANGQINKSTNEKFAYSVYVKGGTVEIAGGNWTNVVSLMKIESGRATVSGGTIQTFSGGNANAAVKGMFNIESGSLTVTGGTISMGLTGEHSAIYATGGTVTITGGLIQRTSRSNCLKIFGEATLLMSGGTVKDVGEAEGGDPTVYLTSTGNNVISGEAVIESHKLNGSSLKVYNSTVEIKDDAQICNSADGGIAVEVKENATLTLSGGTISNTGDNNASTGKEACAVVLEGKNAKVVMTDGKVQQDNEEVAAFNYKYSSGLQVSVSGGVVETASQAVFGGSQQSINAEVTGGTFNKPVTEYVAEGSTAISYTEDGTTLYSVGQAAADVAEAAGKGDTITILKGNALSVADKVTVNNETGNPVAVNGITVEAGAKITAHDFSWKVDESGHQLVCGECGYTGEKAAHTDANGDKVCDVCGYELGSGEPANPVRPVYRDTVTIEVGGEKTESGNKNEENPNTGAPVSAVFIGVLAAARF